MVLLRTAAVIAVLAATSASVDPGARAAIVRSPSSASIDTQGATTVFINYGNLQNQKSMEAMWCSRIVSAAPDLGFRCDPATVWGRLPERNDLSGLSAQTGFTDIMTIPPALVRRAYDAARDRGIAEFYYVRHFISTTGGLDEFVFMVCRLAGAGAGTPLSLVDVRLRFATDTPVLSVRPGSVPPPLSAEIAYTGTGRLRGRWEVIRPGDPPASFEDLVPEGSLAVERRALQRRYLELGRFNVYLPPTGKLWLEGPDPARLPTVTEGLYEVLLRIEASDDRDGGANLASTGEGAGIVPTGGLAGFPLPPLRYYVGTAISPTITVRGTLLHSLLPADGATVSPVAADLTWVESSSVSFYKVEVEDRERRSVATAILRPGVGSYRLPPFVAEKAGSLNLRWRVVALGPDGDRLDATDWRTLRFAQVTPVGPSPEGVRIDGL